MEKKGKMSLWFITDMLTSAFQIMEGKRKAGRPPKEQGESDVDEAYEEDDESIKKQPSKKNKKNSDGARNTRERGGRRGRGGRTSSNKSGRGRGGRTSSNKSSDVKPTRKRKDPPIESNESLTDDDSEGGNIL